MSVIIGLGSYLLRGEREKETESLKMNDDQDNLSIVELGKRIFMNFCCIVFARVNVFISSIRVSSHLYIHYILNVPDIENVLIYLSYPVLTSLYFISL